MHRLTGANSNTRTPSVDTSHGASIHAEPILGGPLLSRICGSVSQVVLTDDAVGNTLHPSIAPGVVVDGQVSRPEQTRQRALEEHDRNAT